MKRLKQTFSQIYTIIDIVSTPIITFYFFFWKKIHNNRGLTDQMSRGGSEMVASETRRGGIGIRGKNKLLTYHVCLYPIPLNQINFYLKIRKVLSGVISISH